MIEAMMMKLISCWRACSIWRRAFSSACCIFSSSTWKRVFISVSCRFVSWALIESLMMYISLYMCAASL